ncbi:hypothetical protein BT93_L1341 [Corymbia citriodora subsp. variegata]|uniref:Uncharacterized protein n=1 Tax=Corymbia citriodora subsp. variegata TaxID=360336 RepID=A0A8T0CSE6_CORYI|nr:hypothetical protein BT93_L1341 [Corymbia citriodora subsp. variegata]
MFKFTFLFKVLISTSQAKCSREQEIGNEKFSFPLKTKTRNFIINHKALGTTVWVF